MDLINGWPRMDVLHGFPRMDVLYGWPRMDVLYGWPRMDVLYGLNFGGKMFHWVSSPGLKFIIFTRRNQSLNCRNRTRITVF